MNDEKTIEEITRLRRQLRMMWIAFGAVIGFVVASIIVSGVLLTRDRVALMQGKADSLRIGPSANGDSLILDGDGFILKNKNGETIAQLKGTSSQGPRLVMQQWKTPGNFLDYLAHKKPKTAPAPIISQKLTLLASNISIENAGVKQVELHTDQGGSGWLILKDSYDNTSMFDANALWAGDNKGNLIWKIPPTK